MKNIILYNIAEILSFNYRVLSTLIIANLIEQLISTRSPLNCTNSTVKERKSNKALKAHTKYSFSL